MKIEMGKTYKTVGGLPVRVLCVDARANGGTTPVVAIVEAVKGLENIVAYTEAGLLLMGDSLYNLVEVSIWDDVAVDAKVLVRDNEGSEWNPRYFAEYLDGVVYTWINGMSSYSCVTKRTISWNFAKLA